MDKAMSKREEYASEYKPERERMRQLLEKRREDEEDGELERIRREREAGGEEVELDRVG